MSNFEAQWFDQVFTIKPKSTESIEIVQITDCHLMLDGQLYEGIDSLSRLYQVLKRLVSLRLDLLVVTGDITQDHTLASYQLLAQACDEVLPNVPVVWLPGNHDDIDDMTQAFVDYPCMNAAKKVVFSVGDWQLLLLNSKGPTPSGLISEQHLFDIEQQLALLQNNDSALVFCHHHPIPMDGYIDKHILNNGAELLQLLAKYEQVKVLAHGHVHQGRECEFAGLEVWATPATAIQFKPHSHDKANDVKGPGYRHIQLTADGGIKSQVYWLAPQSDLN